MHTCHCHLYHASTAPLQALASPESPLQCKPDVDAVCNHTGDRACISTPQAGQQARLHVRQSRYEDGDPTLMQVQRGGHKASGCLRMCHRKAGRLRRRDTTLPTPPRAKKARPEDMRHRTNREGGLFRQRSDATHMPRMAQHNRTRARHRASRSTGIACGPDAM